MTQVVSSCVSAGSPAPSRNLTWRRGETSAVWTLPTCCSALKSRTHPGDLQCAEAAGQARKLTPGPGAPSREGAEATWVAAAERGRSLGAGMEAVVWTPPLGESCPGQHFTGVADQ